MQEKKSRRSNDERTRATRAALIAAGRALFVEKGYAETGTPEIVAAARITRGALYHHFADKAALFRAIVEAEARAVAEAIERDTVDPASALDALMTGARSYFREMTVPGRVRLLLLDGPAVLGHAEMDRIDRETGREELLQGLKYALGGPDGSSMPLEALADLLSAAFDRAALAIAGGGSSAEYEEATRVIVVGLLGKDAGAQMPERAPGNG